jgi:hypothetical protein
MSYRLLNSDTYWPPLLLGQTGSAG